MDVTVVLCESLTDWLMRIVWQFIMCKYEVYFSITYASSTQFSISYFWSFKGAFHPRTAFMTFCETELFLFFFVLFFVFFFIQ